MEKYCKSFKTKTNRIKLFLESCQLVEKREELKIFIREHYFLFCWMNFKFFRQFFIWDKNPTCSTIFWVFSLKGKKSHLLYLILLQATKHMNDCSCWCDRPEEKVLFLLKTFLFISKAHCLFCHSILTHLSNAIQYFFEDISFGARPNVIT